MTARDIVNMRLHNQLLAGKQLDSAGEVVSWMGAIQAQDLLGSFWAVGQRTKSARESDIEKAIADKSIVRTWPMRGTLHYVAPSDVRWMSALLTPRIIQRGAGNYKAAGLVKSDFTRGAKLFEKALSGGKILERKEMYEVLKKGGVSPDGLRGLHIIGHAAQNGLLCLGPRSGKQITFVLLDEWIPLTNPLSKKEALAELARKYFRSHGPATIHDFAWWSGLPVADAKEGLMSVKNEFEEIKYEERSFYMPDIKYPKVDPLKVALLPAYDELLVSYQDRSASIGDGFKAVDSRGAIFTPTLVIGGMVAGNWKRSISKKGVDVEVKAFRKLNKEENVRVKDEIESYKNFLRQK